MNVCGYAGGSQSLVAGDFQLLGHNHWTQRLSTDPHPHLTPNNNTAVYMDKLKMWTQVPILYGKHLLTEPSSQYTLSTLYMTSL